MAHYLDAYDAALLGGAWRRRCAIWYRDHGAWCRGCGAVDQPLDMHHKSYEFELGTEPDEHIVPLCIPCHEAVEDEIERVGERWNTTERMIKRLQKHAHRSAMLKSWMRALLRKGN